MKIRELNEAISRALNEKIKPIKAIKPTAEQKEFLDEIAKMIENEEDISYGELIELQSLQPQIVYIGDIRLAEFSGIPEEVWNISGIDESLKPSKTDKKAMKESVNSIDSIVNSVVIKVNDSFDGTVDKDDLIHEFADDYLGNFDDVIDLFKEIHFNRSDLYDEILRSVSEEIEDRVREKLSDI